MPITFLKYNGPKKLRNGSTNTAYYSSVGGNVTSTTYENGGYNSSSNVDLTNYVNLNGQQSLSGVKNFENGITFGNPIIDASGNYYFGELDGSTGVGGYLRYNEETDKLESTLPISAPNINEITGYKYSQIDSSLDLSDSSTFNFFNAYTTQKLHQRIYALEGKAINHVYQYADIDSSTLNLVDANTDDTFNAYTTQQVHRRLYAVEQLTDILNYLEYDSSLNAIRCTIPFYSNYWLSAGGGNPNTGSGDSSNNINVHQWNDITDYFSDDNTECTFNAYTIQRIYQMAQTAGSVQTITYDDVVDALGFTPMDSSAENVFTREEIINLIGFEPANASTVIQTLNASDISTILGYIPYDSANPSGYLNSGNFKTINGQSLVGTGNIEINIDSTEFDNINTKINDVSTRVSDISTKVSDISTRVAATETGITGLWSTVNQMSDSTNQLSSKIDDISARVATNSATIATYGTQINDISTRLYAMESNPLWSHFHYDSVHNAVYTDTNFYSMGWSSAGGLRDITTAGSGSSSINVHQWDDLTDYFSDDNTDCTFNAYTIQRIYQMAQSAGAQQNIVYDDVIDALGYTPMDASAFDELSAADISTALGYVPANAATVLTNITANTITNALGYTPYNALNPAGYITANDISAMVTSSDLNSLAGKDYVDWAVSNVQTYVDTSLNRMADKMDASLGQFDTSIAAIIETIGSTNESISDRLDTLDGSVAGLTSDIDRIDSSLAAMDSSIGALDTSVIAMQTAMSNYDSSLSNITTQINNLSGIDVIELTALGTTARTTWYTAFVNNDTTKLTNKIFKIQKNTVVQHGTATDASGNTIVTLFTNEYNHTLTSNKFREYEFSSTGNIYPAYTFSALSDGAFNKEGIISKLGYTPYDGSTNPLNFLTSSDIPDYTFQTVDFATISRADRVNIYLGNMDSPNYLYEYSYPATASDASIMPYRIVFNSQNFIDDASNGYKKIFTSVYYNPITDRWETFKYNLLPTGLFTTEKGYLSPDSSASLGAYAEISKINTINGQSLYSPTGSVDLVIDASTSVTSFKTINNQSIVGTGNVQIDEGIPATFVNNIWVGTTAQLQANTVRDASTLYITID